VLALRILDNRMRGIRQAEQAASPVPALRRQALVPALAVLRVTGLLAGRQSLRGASRGALPAPATAVHQAGAGRRRVQEVLSALAPEQAARPLPGQARLAFR